MKISGFTITRNAVKYDYPVLESIRSILPICDEFIINVGDSEDSTLDLIKTLKDHRIRIIENKWDMSMGETVLAHQTNLALRECRGDWAFYLQSDEVIHENDLSYLVGLMDKNLNNKDVDALRLRWLHFYGSYYRYRVDYGWFQKNERIIRNNGEIESYGDAGGFRRVDGRPLKRKLTYGFLYHYGWVHSGAMMTQRRINAERIGFTRLESGERNKAYDYGDMNRFPAYFGTHPAIMRERLSAHALSREDWKTIHRKYWYHPAKILKLRFKTSKRVDKKI